MKSSKTIKEFIMKRCGIIITYRCNLKCKLCTAYSPYYNIPPHFEYKDLALAINKYFDIISHVEKFTVSGGEPMLHSQLNGILNHLLKFSNQLDVIEIITNGTIIPNDKIIQTINKNKNKIAFLVDDYGSALSTNIAQIKNIFDFNKINYVIRPNNTEDAHCGGWIDYGDFSRKLFREKDIKELFDKCAIPQKMNFCFTIKNGELHPCGPSYRCMELGIIPKIKNEYIDLSDENLTIEQQQKKISDLTNIRYLTACAYCNGMCDNSPRFPPAEQLP